MAAAVLRVRLRGLDELNHTTRRRVRNLNDRLAALPGLSEPRCRPDQTRIYYGSNRCSSTRRKPGISKDAAVKALRAEGVAVSASRRIQEQHPLKVYSEAKWWHHAPQIRMCFPGTSNWPKRA